MTYYLRLMLYSRYPQPHYKPVWPDTSLPEQPDFGQERIHRLRLVASIDDESTWPQFVIVRPASESVINNPAQPGQAAILVEVYIVLLSEQEQFLEPFQMWELN